MKSDLVQLVFALLVLVFGGALEELLPKFVGVGFPVLLMSALFVAPRRRAVPAVLFAIAAGGCEDALSALPFAASVCFFSVAALVARTPRASFIAMGCAYPLFEAWLWLWRGAEDVGVFSRMAVAVPVGLVTAPLTAAALLWLERRAAIDE
ncbi:MAG: hypothetical protein J6U17_05670 [Kiritimatiellae bacterium]|nr:hypothetical protein [Kiritimatiellia bacterium]